ncbi:MAG: UDP-glucose/GDP-mannose dehydrogenase family protein [Candidatus Omnitrophica bacterium]|nr:UDP-glucose/GDP-mannose dehydrogenase family protein [Candidatus Omnitrophota bacterium]
MIGFAGLSHLGIVSSIVAASKGHDVVAFDPDVTRCEALRRGQLPVVEPGLQELLASARPRIRFTSDPQALAACAVVICAEDVPTSVDNTSEFGPINRLLDTVEQQAAPGMSVVVLSQVPPGFTRQLARRWADRRLEVFYQAETLIFGQAVERALSPERMIVGCARPQQALPEAYANLLASFSCPILPMRYESAELAKIAINMFLVSSVSTTNILAELCEAIGADWSEIIPALRLDARIGPRAYVTPGLGLSGGNLERDLSTFSRLAQAAGTDARMVEAWLVNSAHRQGWVLTTLAREVLSCQTDPMIAVWGLAYKPHTHSTKNSPALALLETLSGSGIRVQAYDPAIRLTRPDWPRFTQVSTPLEACGEADALAILTSWPEFASVDLTRVARIMRGRLVIDPLGMLDPAGCQETGLRQRRLGVPTLTEDPVLC